MSMPPLFLTIILESVLCDTDLLSHDLENLVCSWPEYRKRLCKFWLKSLQRFRNYWVHNSSMSIAGWPWPSFEPVIFSRSSVSCLPDSEYLWPVSLEYLHSFRRYKGEQRAHRQTEGRADNPTTEYLRRLKSTEKNVAWTVLLEVQKCIQIWVTQIGWLFYYSKCQQISKNRPLDIKKL